MSIVEKILGELLGLTGRTTLHESPEAMRIADSDYIHGTDLLGAARPLVKRGAAKPQAGRSGIVLKRARGNGRTFTALKPGKAKLGNHEMSIRNAREVGKRAQQVGKRLLKALSKTGIHGAPPVLSTRKAKKAFIGKVLTSAQLKQIAERAIKAGKKVVSAADDHERKIKARNTRLKMPKTMLRGDDYNTEIVGADRLAAGTPRSDFEVLGRRGDRAAFQVLGGDGYTEILGRRGEQSRDSFRVLGEDGYTEIIGAPTDPDPLNPGFLINSEPDPNYGGGYTDPYADPFATEGSVDPGAPFDPNNPYGLGPPPTLESVRAEIQRTMIRDPGPETDSRFYSSDPSIAPGAEVPLDGVYCDFSQGVAPFCVGSFNHFYGGKDGLVLDTTGSEGQGVGWLYYTDHGTKARDIKPEHASGDRGPFVRQLSEFSRRSGWGPIVGNPMTSAGSHLPPKSWPYGLRYDPAKGTDGAYFWYRDMAPPWAVAAEEQAMLNQSMLDYRALVAAAAADAAAAAAQEKLEAAQADQLAKQRAKEDEQLTRQWETQDAQIMMEQQRQEAQQAAWEQQFMQQQMSTDQSMEQQYQQLLLQQMQQMQQGGGEYYPGENGQSGGAPWGVDENYQPGVDWDGDGQADEPAPPGYDAYAEEGVDWGD